MDLDQLEKKFLDFFICDSPRKTGKKIMKKNRKHIRQKIGS